MERGEGGAGGGGEGKEVEGEEEVRHWITLSPTREEHVDNRCRARVEGRGDECAGGLQQHHHRGGGAGHEVGDGAVLVHEEVVAVPTWGSRDVHVYVCVYVCLCMCACALSVHTQRVKGRALTLGGPASTARDDHIGALRVVGDGHSALLGAGLRVVGVSEDGACMRCRAGGVPVCRAGWRWWRG